MGVRISLTLVDVFETLLGCLVQPLYEGFHLVLWHLVLSCSAIIWRTAIF